MKILFVSSGNSKNGISPIIENQAQSLIKIGYDVSFFTIQGKGFFGYFRNIFTLRSFLSRNRFDVIHAHYSLSAIVASLAGARPIVVSLMGSDVRSGVIFRLIINFFAHLFWKSVIVKSQEMKDISKIEKSHVIPNGVDFLKFKDISKAEALSVTKWDPKYENILFAADPSRKEKNFKLAKNAFEIMNRPTARLHSIVDIPNDLMPYYYYSADVVILSSLYEGSPNVIKEAMACNKAIVSTNVGDVEEILANTKGCFIATLDPKDYASKLKLALSFRSATNGRENIRYLENSVVALKLIDIYKRTIN